MTNKERQQSLDNQKYLASEKANIDLSGVMPYCKACPHRDAEYEMCAITHEQRVAETSCAKAFNRSVQHGYRKNR